MGFIWNCGILIKAHHKGGICSVFQACGNLSNPETEAQQEQWIMQWSWMLNKCFYPTFNQGIAVGLSVVAPSILLRLLVLFSGLQQRVLNVISTLLGVLVLWWYYERSVAYFIVLCGIVYPLLALVPKGKGALVSISCLIFIFAWYIQTL